MQLKWKANVWSAQRELYAEWMWKVTQWQSKPNATNYIGLTQDVYIPKPTMKNNIEINNDKTPGNSIIQLWTKIPKATQTRKGMQEQTETESLILESTQPHHQPT